MHHEAHWKYHKKICVAPQKKMSAPVPSAPPGPVSSGNLGECGLWLTSVRNIRELARNDGFNEFFRKQFNGNKATYLRWKEVFDVLEIEEEKKVQGQKKKQQRKKTDPRSWKFWTLVTLWGGCVVILGILRMQGNT